MNMSNILKRLKDPKLVASFQRKCGIIPKTKSSHCSKSKSNHGSCPSGLPNNDIVSENDFDEINGNVKTMRKRIVDESDKFHDPTDHSAPDADTQISSDSSSDESNGTEFVITNKILHYMFEFGASLGNEFFYITFFPFWFWNVDGYVGRRVLIFWATFMYLGQATKDIIRWPRPASPPVMRLEQRYALEYGMPSTHAMVGAGLPFSLFILTQERYEYPYALGLTICIIWCSLVCGSRLYLGMHTVLDVLVGLVYVFLLKVLMFPFLDAIDDFVLTHSYAPVVSILVPLTFALCYPTLDKWSTARGDTTLVLAVTGGICFGHWFCYQYDFMQKATTQPPFQIIYPTWPYFGQMLLRLCVGVVILIATRTIFKLLSYNLVCYLVGVSKEDMKAHQKLSVELPYKFTTYTAVAINSVLLVPQVFRYLGIERETYFTEV